MSTLLALVVGGLYAAGIYVMLRRNVVKLVMGLVLLGHAANLLIFTAAGLTRAAPPIIRPDAAQLEGGAADPLPQALVLTAIVIGFGIQSFALILIRRAHRVIGTDDVDAMRATDR
jgi:multicomponent Na+:H+ antiporter subunit C